MWRTCRAILTVENLGTEGKKPRSCISYSTTNPKHRDRGFEKLDPFSETVVTNHLSRDGLLRMKRIRIML